MDDKPSIDASVSAQPRRGNIKNLTPFPPGTSGCPGGAVGVRRRALASLTDALTAHLGRALSQHETTLVEQLAVAKAVKPANTTDALRQAALIARLTTRLFYDAKPAVTPTPALQPVPSGDELMARSRARMATT